MVGSTRLHLLDSASTRGGHERKSTHVLGAAMPRFGDDPTVAGHRQARRPRPTAYPWRLTPPECARNLTGCRRSPVSRNRKFTEHTAELALDTCRRRTHYDSHLTDEPPSVLNEDETTFEDAGSQPSARTGKEIIVAGRTTRRSAFTPVSGLWEWQLRAACRGMASAVFYAPPGERGNRRRTRERQAQLICEGCPVRQQCAEFALTLGEAYGVWGGLTETERRPAEHQAGSRIHARPGGSAGLAHDARAS